MTLKSWQWWVNFVAVKLAAIGVVLVFFLLIAGRFNLYNMGDIMGSMMLWWIFYVYAVSYSILVDLADAGMRRVSMKASRGFVVILLYIAGGYLPFFVWFRLSLLGSLMIGFIGVLCSLCFFGLEHYLKVKWTWFKNVIAALALLVVLLSITYVDFTTTRQWEEVRTDEAYEVTFAYFHGEKAIPIKLQRGQKLTFTVDLQKVYGGRGSHVLDQRGRLVGLQEIGQGRMQFTAEQDAVYRIVVTGDQASGAVKVNWEIEEH
ncbi:hypothetical protein EBB07_17900 [Paenibacillaceae bacterium]|nr:hypothetical protein EBB07_17900 [Paenibacillaceae bacterium]